VPASGLPPSRVFSARDAVAPAEGDCASNNRQAGISATQSCAAIAAIATQELLQLYDCARVYLLSRREGGWRIAASAAFSRRPASLLELAHAYRTDDKHRPKTRYAGNLEEADLLHARLDFSHHRRLPGEVPFPRIYVISKAAHCQKVCHYVLSRRPC
jgi:hypothetical protein